MSKPLLFSFSSFKGGSSKTTLTVMLAKHLAARGKKVIVVDLDPRGGSTSLLHGGKLEGLKDTAYILAGFKNGLEPTDLVRQAVLKAKAPEENLFLIPSTDSLNAYKQEPPETLRHVFTQARFPPDTVMVVDSGIDPEFVSMTIACVDTLVVPMQPSPQAGRPTVDTIRLVIKYQVSRSRELPRLLGLLPIGIADTQWEQRIIEHRMTALGNWYKQHVGVGSGKVFSPIPYSRVLLRGSFVGRPAEQSRFAPQMDEIYEALFNAKVEEDERFRTQYI